MIAQAREGIMAQIAVNRSVVTIARARLVDDGFDGLVQDPINPITRHKIACRISHEFGVRMGLESAPSGFTTNLSRYILVSHTTDIKMGDIFDWHGKGYEIGPVDPLYYNDMIIGYQAPLKESSNADEITQCG
jgi:hypothetical protein